MHCIYEYPCLYAFFVQKGTESDGPGAEYMMRLILLLVTVSLLASLLLVLAPDILEQVTRDILVVTTTRTKTNYRSFFVLNEKFYVEKKRKLKKNKNYGKQNEPE